MTNNNHLLRLDNIKAFILHSFASVVITVTIFDDSWGLDLTCEVSSQYWDVHSYYKSHKQKTKFQREGKLNHSIQIKNSTRRSSLGRHSPLPQPHCPVTHCTSNLLQNLFTTELRSSQLHKKLCRPENIFFI